MSIVWTSICTFRETKIKKKDCCGHDFLFKMHSLLCFCNLHFNYRSFNRHSLDWPWWNLAVPSIIIECDRMFLWYGHLWTAGKNDVKIEENGFFRCLHKRKCLLLYRMVLYISHDSLGWDGWKESNLACLPDSSNSDSSKQHKNDSKGQWSELTPRWWIPNWPKRPAFSIWMLLFNIQMLYGTPFTRWHSRALWMSKWDEKKKSLPLGPRFPFWILSVRTSWAKTGLLVGPKSTWNEATVTERPVYRGYCLGLRGHSGGDRS